MKSPYQFTCDLDGCAEQTATLRGWVLRTYILDIDDPSVGENAFTLYFCSRKHADKFEETMPEDYLRVGEELRS